MTPEEINFLQSLAGTALLQQYQDYDEEALFRLLRKSAKHQSIPFLSAVVTLIKLRRRAAGKFSRSGAMFFTTLNLEQSTGERIARHIAARFKPEWRVADLTCGLGGNAIFLAEQCRQVLALDISDNNIQCARANAAAYSLEDKISFIKIDAREALSDPRIVGSAGPVWPIDAFFLDPARDRAGKTKTRSILNSQPPLLELLPKMMEITKNIGVKISPAFDYKELELLPAEPEVEVISEAGTVKVVMLWFGKLKTVERRATILSTERQNTDRPPGDTKYEYTDNSPLPLPPLAAVPLQYLYEPDKALSKAHLVAAAAAPYSLSLINAQLSFLTGSKLVGEDKPGLWRTFKVLTYGQFSWSNLQQLLKDRKIERLNILTKKFPLLPDEVYKKLKIKEGGNLFLIMTVFSDETRSYILAERI